MQLDQWVRDDMKRFLKQFEPQQQKQHAGAREEDAAQLQQIEYHKRIKRALDSDRLHEAKRLFNDLKQRFFTIPPDHLEERRRFYLLLQQCYHDIYNYVDDRQKRQQILAQFNANTNADVFDDQNQTVQIRDLSMNTKHKIPAHVEKLKIPVESEESKMEEAIPVKQVFEQMSPTITEKIIKPQSPRDQELFSAAYLKGMHALGAGDYKAALRFFQQRVQQAPADIAAQIRLKECMEALHGANT